MYIRRDQADALLETSMSAIRQRIETNLAFIKELLAGDDWSFVIKTQALLEACITEAILIKLGDERIRRTVETMPLAGEEVSKLQLTKDLNLMDTSQRRFVKKIASLRNKLAHRVEYVNFAFPDYIASLDRDAKKDWQESIVWFAEAPGSRAQWRETSIIQPRSAVLMGAFVLAAILAVDENQEKLLRAIDSASEETTTDLLRLLDSASGA